MKGKNEKNPYDALKRVFHEPYRLAVMSNLCGAVEGLSFNELKDECGLTDGNLSRHLKALEEAGAIRIRKSFVGSRPRTTVFASEDGREGFLEYLKALEEVLSRAAESVGADTHGAEMQVSWKDIIRSLNQ